MYQETFNGIEIKKAKGGIALYDGMKTIYINQDLYKYPDLLQKVIDHEMEHVKDVTQEKNLKQAIINAFNTELKDRADRKKNYQLLIFALKHPRALLPYMHYENKKIIIMNQVFVWIFTLIFFGLVYFVILNFI